MYTHAQVLDLCNEAHAYSSPSHVGCICLCVCKDVVNHSVKFYVYTSLVRVFTLPSTDDLICTLILSCILDLMLVWVCTPVVPSPI